ncbi:MAG: hypothetical protein OHK0046_51250 [Anaerolineae bacterium]
MIQQESRQREAVFEAAAHELQRLGLKARWYVCPAGYGMELPVHTLEARLGPSEVAGYAMYGVAQVFSPEYPSLAVVYVIERHEENGSIGTHQPTFNVENDKHFSRVFLPRLFTAFNPLDPTGQQRGVLVQLYNARLSAADLIGASGYTLHLMTSFKKQGQLALIAVDFDTFLMRLVSSLAGPIAALVTKDIYQIARTRTPSALALPVEDGQGGFTSINTSSTALDAGLDIARQMLDTHYQQADLAKL